MPPLAVWVVTLLSSYSKFSGFVGLARPSTGEHLSLSDGTRQHDAFTQYYRWSGKAQLRKPWPTKESHGFPTAPSNFATIALEYCVTQDDC